MSNKCVEFLKEKYQKDEIYILVGKVLLAINPYKNIDINKMYSDCDINSAHVFSIAEEARRNVLSRPQSIIITGETGAGKTETTKHIIGYLCETAQKDLMIALNSAGPIFNAFGNAKTVKNRNSSRYCKFVEIHYDSKLEVIGGNIRTFMLERSRILEYHIFGSLLNAPKHIKAFLKVDDPQFENTVRNSEALMSLEELDKSLGHFFSQAKKYEIYQFLHGIICLSKITFQNDANEYSTISSKRSLELAAQLLSFDQKDLTAALTIRTIQLPGENGEKISMHLSVAQAKQARDALIRTIYVNFHGWLVRQINKKIDPGYLNYQQRYYIGILDMAGFECFTTNSFEQLMINYANESVQHFSIQSVVKENSLLDSFNHKDVIDLIENPEIGILTLLDNASKLQCANFAEIVYEKWESSPVLIRKKLSPITSFTVRHYVSDVTYQTEYFVEKNTEIISETILRLGEISLRNITDSIVTLIKTNKRFMSEGMKLKKQLEILLKTLSENGSNFIRCIKPNDSQCSEFFDEACVYKQLLTTGTDFLIQNEANLWQLGENAAGEYHNGSRSIQCNKLNDSQCTEFSDEACVHEQPLMAGSYFIIEGESNLGQLEENAGGEDKSGDGVDGDDVEDTQQHKRARKSSRDENKRFDKYDHWLEYDSRQSGNRCKYNRCNKTVHTYCSKCQVYLCSLRNRNCFKAYHHR